MINVYQKVIETIEQYKMMDGVKSVLLGFSGGADSTALLHCLSRISDITVYAVHVNHGIRGDEALRDQRFCEEFCRNHGIELFVETVDVPKLAEDNGLSVEEAARYERYRIFDELRLKYSIARVVTAHNSGDNIETVLFNMTRGTSLRGLCGIPPVRDNIIRPLIECGKADIIAYCNDNELGYVIDSTNNETVYTRNFIRSEIVPKLKSVNPAAETAVTRMCKSLRSDDDYLSAEADKLPDVMTVSELANLHDAMLSRWLLRKHDGLNYAHITKLMEMIRSGEDNSVSLTGNITFKIAGDEIIFKKYSKPERKFIPKTMLKLGENHVSGCDFMIFLTHNEKDIKLLKNIYKLFIHKVVNFDKIIGYIYVRSRENGDKYIFGGMTRNVKKLLCDRHIPIDERDSIPFICDDEGILWIPEFDVRDNVKFTDGNNSLHIVFLQGERNDTND
jgi:tRNA(Ile)-lysidine synthetase, N-terminal domain/tRNA(Ile)-lysidine synthetase, C-terminal domain